VQPQFAGKAARRVPDSANADTDSRPGAPELELCVVARRVAKLADWQIIRITGKGACIIGEVQASAADAAIRRAIVVR